MNHAPFTPLPLHSSSCDQRTEKRNASKDKEMVILFPPVKSNDGCREKYNEQSEVIDLSCFRMKALLLLGKHGEYSGYNTCECACHVYSDDCQEKRIIGRNGKTLN